MLDVIVGLSKVRTSRAELKFCVLNRVTIFALFYDRMHRGGFPPGPPFRDEMMLSSNLRPDVDVPLSQDPMDPKRQRALRSVFSK